MDFQRQNSEVILFFGASGSGKSSTINSISGTRQCNVSTGGASLTKGCQMVHIDRKESMFYGKKLLDMQGYYDTRVGESTNKLFEKIKLYFLENDITKVRAIIFVISLTGDRNNYYDKFVEFLGELFTEREVTKNAIVLLTKGDRLDEDEKYQSLHQIKMDLLQLKNDIGWSMEFIEWSNKTHLINQEKKLFDAVSQMSGFDPKRILQDLENEINAEAQRQYESADNIYIVNHDAKQELKESKVNRQVEDFVTIDCSETTEKIIPEENEEYQFISEKIVHFKGHITQEGGFLSTIGNSLVRLNSLIGVNKLMTSFVGDQIRTETKTVEFDDPVVSVTLDKMSGDDYLRNELSWKYADNDTKKVVITAKFTWGGGVILTWDFDLKVIATLRRTIVKKAAHKDIIVVPKQKVEKVIKNVTDIDKQLVTVKEAYQEKVYKLSIDDIKKSIINRRITKLA